MKTHSKILTLIYLLTIAAFTGCRDEEEVPRNQENKLVAVAGEDRNMKVNEVITLDGSASRDGNNKPFTYLWSIKTKPEGSNALLGANNIVQTTFKPDKIGTYIIQLKITQSSWNAADELIVIVTSAEPNTPSTIILSQNILTATTLNNIIDDPSQPDYIINTDIEAHADLTIMPGVIISFEENKSLQIMNGTIRAKGDAGNGIIFKGLDNRPGYWRGITIHSNSESNEFDYVTIQHAGAGNFSESVAKANLILIGSQFTGAALKLNHSNFIASGGYGLYVQGKSYLNEFADNRFDNNNLAAAYFPAQELHKGGSIQVSLNGFNGIETGGSIYHEIDVLWAGIPNGAYLVSSDIVIHSGVNIGTGTQFKMKQGTTISVSSNGYLSAIGVPSSKIIFASHTGNGRWNGIYFNSSNSNNRIDYCEVSDAGLNKIGGADHPANITIGDGGIAEIKNSVIKNGLGYGVVAKATDRFNNNIATVNTFENLQKGNVFPAIDDQPDKPALTGVWLDYWSFRHGATSVSDNYYNTETGVWFGGAARPWDITGAGFGIRFNENGNFVWTVAEHSPMNGCESYSAEYMTGTTTITPTLVTFSQELWRSKFINSCDESHNVDTGVTPSDVELPYQLNWLKGNLTGEYYWELKFTNPDQSSFSYYRKA